MLSPQTGPVRLRLFSHVASHRVQLAVLKQADGSFERFARSLAQATSDWRDVLVAAGLVTMGAALFRRRDLVG